MVDFPDKLNIQNLIQEGYARKKSSKQDWILSRFAGTNQESLPFISGNFQRTKYLYLKIISKSLNLENQEGNIFNNYEISKMS